MSISRPISVVLLELFTSDDGLWFSMYLPIHSDESHQSSRRNEAHISEGDRIQVFSIDTFHREEHTCSTKRTLIRLREIYFILVMHDVGRNQKSLWGICEM